MRTGIGFGSNLGDRLENLRAASVRVLALPGAGEPVLRSRIYETDPVGADAAGEPYLNAVVEMEFNGAPIMLLDALGEIEIGLGRPSKRPRNAARIIDLDILYAGNHVLANDEIMIPHPRLHSRRFVLAPLAELRPELILPGQHATIAALLAALPQAPRAAIFSGGDW